MAAMHRVRVDAHDYSVAVHQDIGKVNVRLLQDAQLSCAPRSGPGQATGPDQGPAHIRTWRRARAPMLMPILELELDCNVNGQLVRYHIHLPRSIRPGARAAVAVQRLRVEAAGASNDEHVDEDDDDGVSSPGLDTTSAGAGAGASPPTLRALLLPRRKTILVYARPDLANVLADVPDGVSWADLALVGTHDSCAIYGGESRRGGVRGKAGLAQLDAGRWTLGPGPWVLNAALTWAAPYAQCQEPGCDISRQLLDGEAPAREAPRSRGPESAHADVYRRAIL